MLAIPYGGSNHSASGKKRTLRGREDCWIVATRSAWPFKIVHTRALAAMLHSLARFPRHLSGWGDTRTVMRIGSELRAEATNGKPYRASVSQRIYTMAKI